MPAAVILNVFNQWDTDCDGVIKLPELKAVCLTLGLHPDDITDVWSKADDRNNGFLDYTRFSTWIRSDDAPSQIKDEITSWIMEGTGKTKSDLSDWTFHPWVISRDKDVYTQLTLRENGSFEQQVIRLSVGQTAVVDAPPLCVMTGSGTWELDTGDCILRYSDGRTDGYTFTKLKRLHEENAP